MASADPNLSAASDVSRSSTPLSDGILTPIAARSNVFSQIQAGGAMGANHDDEDVSLDDVMGGRNAVAEMDPTNLLPASVDQNSWGSPAASQPQPPFINTIIPICVRIVPTDQWFKTHVDISWSVFRTKLHLLHIAMGSVHVHPRPPISLSRPTTATQRNTTTTFGPQGSSTGGIIRPTVPPKLAVHLPSPPQAAPTPLSPSISTSPRYEVPLHAAMEASQSTSSHGHETPGSSFTNTSGSGILVIPPSNIPPTPRSPTTSTSSHSSGSDSSGSIVFAVDPHAELGLDEEDLEEAKRAKGRGGEKKKKAAETAPPAIPEPLPKQPDPSEHQHRQVGPLSLRPLPPKSRYAPSIMSQATSFHPGPSLTSHKEQERAREWQIMSFANCFSLKDGDYLHYYKLRPGELLEVHRVNSPIYLHRGTRDDREDSYARPYFDGPVYVLKQTAPPASSLTYPGPTKSGAAKGKEKSGLGSKASKSGIIRSVGYIEDENDHRGRTGGTRDDGGGDTTHERDDDEGTLASSTAYLHPTQHSYQQQHRDPYNYSTKPPHPPTPKSSGGGRGKKEEEWKLRLLCAKEGKLTIWKQKGPTYGQADKIDMYDLERLVSVTEIWSPVPGTPLMPSPPSHYISARFVIPADKIQSAEPTGYLPGLHGNKEKAKGTLARGGFEYALEVRMLDENNHDNLLRILYQACKLNRAAASSTHTSPLPYDPRSPPSSPKTYPEWRFHLLDRAQLSGKGTSYLRNGVATSHNSQGADEESVWDWTDGSEAEWDAWKVEFDEEGGEREDRVNDRAGSMVNAALSRNRSQSVVTSVPPSPGADTALSTFATERDHYQPARRGRSSTVSATSPGAAGGGAGGAGGWEQTQGEMLEPLSENAEMKKGRPRTGTRTKSSGRT